MIDVKLIEYFLIFGYLGVFFTVLCERGNIV